MQTVGTILGAVLTAYVAVATISLLIRTHLLKQRERLSLDLLRQQIATATAKKLRQERARSRWNGVRKFVVDKKVKECHDTWSFYLKPHDRKPLPPFDPGQFLTFRLSVPGHDRPVVRCYSISSPPNPDFFRITVRRVAEGRASAYLHDQVREGTLLDVLAPRGGFCIDVSRQRPTVLVGGGVGITPLVSMLGAAAAARSGRETRLFYSVRKPADLIMTDYLRALPNEHEHISVAIGASRTGEDESAGSDMDFAGRVTIDFLRSVLPSNNFDFYICGPPSMMESLVPDLRGWGVPQDCIHTEAFGADSVNAVSAALPVPEVEAAQPPTTQSTSAATVRFCQTEKSVDWSREQSDLLSLAESMGIAIDSGCRAGSCGSCVTAIRSGCVRYLESPEFECDAGSCLPCIAVPDGNLDLDA